MYNSYNGRANGSNSMSSSSLVQNYSLLYSSSGPVYNSRVGRYDVSLGYNWSSIDTTIKSSTQPTENYNASRGHILYKGEINLDPKEIPLKLNLYSRDLTRNTVTNSYGRGQENFASILGSRDNVTGINDGLHIESGATLVAGVKNGMTNGYYEVMRHFPMIIVDYKDTINRDLNSVSPINDRLSRLAFVSLNKKDNWFHYRLMNYNDYLDSSNNYVEKQFQIGTVDQYMARRWIDFSNWLKVSTDLQLSKRKNNDQKYAIEDINLNLFVTAERANWNARTFTSFNRYRDEYNKLTYLTNLPLYASGVVNQDISWNARTSFRDNHDIDIKGVRSKFTNMLLGYRVDAFKRAPFTLSQRFDVESSNTNQADFITLSGALETASTTKFSRTVSLGASYNIKNSSTSPTTSTSSASSPASDFLEQSLDLRGGYAPTNTVRFEARQYTAFTNGNLVAFSGTTRDSNTQLSQYITPRDIKNADIGSKSFHSISTLIASWNPKPRLNTYLGISEDIYNSNLLETNHVTNVTTSISYTNQAWSVSDTLKYSRGNRETLDEKADSITNSASLKYIHSRNLDASASASYTSYMSGSYSKGGDSHDTSIEQRLNYNLYTKSGIARKYLEFNETLMYTDGSALAAHEFKKGLSLGFKYYPINRLTLAAGVWYSYTTRISEYTLAWNASVAANFRLLQASIDYARGIRKIDGAIEDKFTGNVRKSF